MEWLNYHHLLYFWTVAREGGIVRASEKLLLAPPTLSGQIRKLERSLGEKLFARSGRNLVLTEMGRLVLRYADEIFTIGRELQDAIKGRPTGRPLTLAVGVAQTVPKLIAYRLLSPGLSLPGHVRVVCREDALERLLAELAVHGLDIVISDSPAAPTIRVRVYNHRLGGCAVSVFAEPRLARRLRRGFPRSLEGAPFLFPTKGSLLRASLEQWFEAHGLRPEIMGEFDDSALLKVFGQAGAGAFVGPSAIEAEIQSQYGVRVVHRIEEVRENFFAISVERRLKHPAVIAISNAARTAMFRAGDA